MPKGKGYGHASKSKRSGKRMGYGKKGKPPKHKKKGY